LGLNFLFLSKEANKPPFGKSQERFFIVLVRRSNISWVIFPAADGTTAVHVIFLFARDRRSAERNVKQKQR